MTLYTLSLSVYQDDSRVYHKKRKDYSRSQELSKTRIKKERTIDIKARELQIIKKD